MGFPLAKVAIIVYNIEKTNHSGKDGAHMGKRHNTVFLSKYMELDKLCCEKFGVNTGGGVIEYINRLSNARFAPGRDEVLSRLIGYSNTHKRFYYEPGAMRGDTQISQSDINWVIKFKSQVARKRDPVSRYLRRARGYAFRKKLTGALWGVLLVAFVAAVIAMIIILK